MSLIILIWICLYWCGREGIIIKTVPGESSNIVPVWCNTLLLGTRALLSVTLSIPGIIITLLMSKTKQSSRPSRPPPSVLISPDKQNQQPSESGGSTRCESLTANWDKRKVWNVSNRRSPARREADPDSLDLLHQELQHRHHTSTFQLHFSGISDVFGH